MEHEIRRRLRDEFQITLPQFDILAELEHVGDAMNMTELSHHLMVSNGNVTGVVTRLIREGLVERISAPEDRRQQLIRLTPKGVKTFRKIAAAHEQWIAEMFGKLNARDIDQLLSLLSKAHNQLRHRR